MVSNRVLQHPPAKAIVLIAMAASDVVRHTATFSLQNFSQSSVLPVQLVYASNKTYEHMHRVESNDYGGEAMESISSRTVNLERELPE